MSEPGGRPPAPAGGKKSSGGGFWGFVNKVLENVSIEANVGKPSTSAPPSRPADPASRMEPVRADRQETHDEMIYRTTDGEHGQAPMVRVDRERQMVARSLGERETAARSVDARQGHDREVAIPRNGGEPLSKELRRKMEPQLGADLAGVRVHRAGESGAAAQALSAKAFTVGSDVHFGSGQFAPGTKEGDRLIAHELTHVVQGQRSGVQRKADGGDEHADTARHEGRVSDPGEPAEKEADSVADHVTEQLHGDGKAASHGKPAADGKAAPAAAAPPIAAKRDGGPPAINATYRGVGRKIFRVPGPTAQPAPASPGGAGAGGTPAPSSPPVRKVAIPTIAGGKAQLTPRGNGLEVTENGVALADKLAAAVGKMTGARSPRAGQELTTAGNKVQAAQNALAAIKPEGAQIKETDLATVTTQGNAAGQALLDLRRALRVATTEEIGLGTKTVQPAWTATLKYGKNKIDDKDFQAEYDRQLDVHERAINALNVDEWLTNIQVYELQAKNNFEEAEEATKQAMVAELKSRIKIAQGQLDRQSAKFKKAVELMTKVDEAVKAADKKPQDAALQQSAKDATLAFMSDPYVLKNFTGRILTPRQEGRFKSEHLAGLQAVVKEDQAKWTAAGDAGEWGTILHLPDQVAGGRGFLPKYNGPIPKPPADGEPAPKEWTDYLKWLRDYIGSARVNSSIGGSWEQAASSLRTAASTFFADTPAAQPIYKVNVKLSKAPNND